MSKSLRYVDFLLYLGKFDKKFAVTRQQQFLLKLYKEHSERVEWYKKVSQNSLRIKYINYRITYNSDE